MTMKCNIIPFRVKIAISHFPGAITKVLLVTLEHKFLFEYGKRHMIIKGSSTIYRETIFRNPFSVKLDDIGSIDEYF